jgi:hypothetical protein
MLAVLALIGVAFVTYSAEEEQSSSRYQATFQLPRADIAPEVVFLEALNQLIADTNNQQSAMRGQSLLADMYGQGSDYSVGPDGRPGVAGVDDDGANGTDDVGELGWPGSDDRTNRLEAMEWYQGAFTGPGDRGLYQPVHMGPDGLPGTYDDCFDLNFVWNGRLPNPVLGALAGGFNEDYDYPDRQNMFLALLRADGTTIAASFNRPGVGGPADPDLAVTAATALVAGRTAPVPPSAADQRARLKLLRPRGGYVDSDADGQLDPTEPRTENPLFPPFDPLVLDVDNNGDGIRDSVWIDLGWRVQQTANGRRFKPLFAFLVTDADGKLNLNVHGNIANVLLTPPGHADFDTSGNVLGKGYSPAEVALQNIFKDVGSLPGYALLPGIGPEEYHWLLTGRPAGGGPPAPIPGRYGAEVDPTTLQTLIGTATPPRAGKTNTVTTPPAPSVMPASGDDDNPATPGTPPYWAASPARGNALEGLRAVYNNYILNAVKNGRYGTPADFNGDGGLGVDGYGRFIYFASDPRMGWGGVTPEWPGSMGGGHMASYDNVDDQTELDVYTSRATDEVFSTSDMEYLYRRTDLDSSSLYSRLAWLTPSLVPTPDTLIAARRRMMLTSDSWDLIRFNMFPLTQPVGIPYEPIETELNVNRQRGSGRFNTNGLRGVSTALQMATSPGLVPDPSVLIPGSNLFGLPPGLPVEIARGRRLNLNRGYFGTFTTPGTPYYRSPVPHLNTPGNTDPRTVARDIYILLRQLHPVNPLDLTPGGGRDQCEQMAQYAVNFVDFRDSDQIMTGFEFVYDLSTTGWFVDGQLDGGSSDNADPNRGLVWGVEAPQVVINETYAIEEVPNPPALWFELYNPQHFDDIDNAFRVDLRGPGTDSAYQVVLADTNPGVPGGATPVGEPSDTSRRLEFTGTPSGGAVGGTGPTLVDPNPIPAPLLPPPAPQTYYLVGPRAVNGITPDFVSDAAFSPTIAEIGADLRVYLRRLADPTSAHDAGPDGVDGTADDVNPYLTVDALDVRVFADAEVNPPPPLTPTHHSLERVVPYSVKREPHSNGVANPHTLKALNERSSLNSGIPYAPLPFNDRPFASSMEMLLVPATRPQWLTSTFVAPNAAFSPYSSGANRPPPIRTGDSMQVNSATPFMDAPYYFAGHLLNFFREELPLSYPAPGSYQQFPVPGFHRIFEFVEVPSRMAGSSDPTIFPVTGENRLDRVPGKMNINTAIAEEEQFLAMFNNHPLALGGVSPAWPLPAGPLARPLPPPGNQATLGQIAFPCQPSTTQVRSELHKRCLDSMFGPDGILGTADDLPFRSPSIGPATTAAPQMIQATDIHNTIFRGWPTAGGFPVITAPPRTSPGQPLFLDSRTVSPPGSSAPDLLGYPNFQNQPLEKISNIVTTRSNVFAVWITVGYFEVLNEDPNRLNGPAPNDFGVPNAPPELGPEINADTGQNIRHRAFFIIDRSKARGYNGPTRTSAELQDILSQVLIHSRIIE